MTIQTVVLNELFQDWKGNMSTPFTTHECCFFSPIRSGNRPCDKSRFEARGLVDESKTIFLFDHPLHISGCGCGIYQLEFDACLRKHFGQARMS